MGLRIRRGNYRTRSGRGGAGEDLPTGGGQRAQRLKALHRPAPPSRLLQGIGKCNVEIREAQKKGERYCTAAHRCQKQILPISFPLLSSFFIFFFSVLVYFFFFLRKRSVCKMPVNKALLPITRCPVMALGNPTTMPTGWLGRPGRQARRKTWRK